MTVKEARIILLCNNIIELVFAESRGAISKEIIEGESIDLNILKEEAIRVVLNELENNYKILDSLKSKLEEHIKHCEQEAEGSLHNEVCNISLKFNKSLLKIIDDGGTNEATN